MVNTENMLKEQVKKLFHQGKVDLVIGYEKGSLPLSSRPSFFEKVDDVDRLVWNSRCGNNLAVYLPRFFANNQSKKDNQKQPTIGIIAKGCDARSVAGLIIENQIQKENIIIIAVPCQGILNDKKIKASLKNDSVSECIEKDDNTVLVKTGSGSEVSLNKKDILSDACLECSYPVADNADIVIEGAAKNINDDNNKYAKIIEFENKSIEERWEYFRQEMSKCIRCYACRQACPNCYCTSCFADQTRPGWIGKGNHLADIMGFHIGRMFHQAGRCVECGACVRACPMGIDLRMFTGKLAKDIKELYGFTPGCSTEATPPLCTFTQDDSEDFITEP